MSSYSKTGKPIQGSRGISKEVRDEFSLIETAVNSKADINSPAFTGTPAAPTPTLGDSSTKLATTAFVAGTASSAALPGQLGNASKFVTTDGTTATWEHAQVITRNTQTAAYTVVEGDRGKVINWTGSSNATLSLTAAATLGSGWYCYVQNTGTATLTIDPDGAEAIDGETTIAIQANESCIVQCNGTNFLTIPIGAVAPIKQSDRTSNTQLIQADLGKLINITSGTFTQTFAAAAMLGDGWWCHIHNNGTGDITLDPDSTETIDGISTYIMYPGEVRKVICDGSALRSIVLNAFSRTFTSSGTFTRPPGYSAFSGLLWGGGGSGARTTTAGSNSGGGGGGAANPFTVPSSLFGASQVVTIASGGAAQTTANANGNDGGNSTVGSILTSYGGAGGTTSSTNADGGGGGGLLSSGSGLNGGEPSSESATLAARVFGGGLGAGPTVTNKFSIWGGGGGARATDSSAENAGGSTYGGGGGGSVSDAAAQAGSGGASVFGGAGGNGGLDASGTAGSQPSGGGGGTHNGVQSGAGGNGQLTIWGII